MKVHGTCHCGAIAFEGEAQPGTVGVCHCSDCQKLTGSAFRANVSVPSESFAITRGSPRVYIKTADSGARRAHAFCPDCGTPVYATAAENPTSYSLRIGTLDQRKDLGAPARQIWCDSGLPWAVEISGVPKFSGQP